MTTSPDSPSQCDETIDEAPIKKTMAAGWLRKVLAVEISAAILYYYFRDLDWERLADACRNANLGLAVAAILVPQLVFWFMETLLTERAIVWFHGPLPFWKFFWVRGALYILTFVNTLLGNGGLLIYIQRKACISWRKLLGIFLFRVGVMLWGVALLLIPPTLVMEIMGMGARFGVLRWAWWTVLLAPGLLFMISNMRFWFLGKDTTGLGKVLVKDRGSEFWTAFQNSTPRQWLLVWAMALPPFAATIVGFYFLNLAFGVEVPFVEFMVTAPLALLIMDLPIAFAGFGTATLGWMAFYEGYAPFETLAALTLFLPAVRSAGRAVIGLVSLPPALKDIASISSPKTETAAD